MATFDYTFDYTFQGLPPDSLPGVTAPANACGVNVMFLTLAGWDFWTFEAKRDTLTAIERQGTFKRRGTLVDTQKVTAPKYIIRTGGLTETESAKINSLLSSVAVYWLYLDVNGKLISREVYVEETESTIWKELDSSGNFELTIALATVDSLFR